ncbi:uncharacterized protein LOC103995566 [Musa acuminata AAA Group]|uniref:uncharacterized protein LOC103995566 n=1 Tax=Musa acuminata AAA Group TaxID=214697 RepID=UPI0031DE94CF
MAAKGGGNIGSTSIDGVNLFSLSGQRFVSTWLPPKKLRALRKDKGKGFGGSFAYDEYREKQKKEKMEAKQASHITIQKRLPKVNRLLAARLHIAEESEMENMDDAVAKKKSNKNRVLTSEIHRDAHFAAMFMNKDF